MSQSTYAIDGYTLAIQTDGNLGALPLFYAADTADACSMRAPSGGANRLGQSREGERCADGFIRRHDVGQTSSGRVVGVCVGRSWICARKVEARAVLEKKFRALAEKRGRRAVGGARTLGVQLELAGMARRVASAIFHY